MRQTGEDDEGTRGVNMTSVTDTDAWICEHIQHEIMPSIISWQLLELANASKNDDIHFMPLLRFQEFMIAVGILNESVATK